MGDRIEVTDEVCARLGKSREQIKRLSLRKLAALAHSKGLAIRVPPWEEAAPGEGHLSIEMATEALKEIAGLCHNRLQAVADVQPIYQNSTT